MSDDRPPSANATGLDDSQFRPGEASRRWPRPHLIAAPNSTSFGDNRVSTELKQAWRNEGFVHLKNVFQPEEVRAYNAIVDRVRATIDDGKDEQGFGDRVGQLHQQERDLLKLAASTRITDFLTWAFGEEPVLMGSLQFEKGTQQEAHIDAIFFWPEPAYAMAGAWVALEDIDPDSGPLFYIPQSHRLPFFNSDDLVAGDAGLADRRAAARAGTLTTDEKTLLVHELGVAWTRKLRELHDEYQGERVNLPVKAGDVIIWHSLLAHGGSPRNNSNLSRRSAVFHYFGKTAGLYSFEQFMLNDRDELPKMEPLNMSRRSAFGLEYMVFPSFTAYPGGVETAHPVKQPAKGE